MPNTVELPCAQSNGTVKAALERIEGAAEVAPC